jgi:cell division protein FtsN
MKKLGRIRLMEQSRAQSGGTFLGFLLGLLIGLAVAVIVAVFVTKAPVPFLNKTGKTSERVLEPKSAAETPDPNKSLYAKNKPSVDAASGPVAATEPQAKEADGEKKDSILGLLGTLGGAQTPKPDASPAPVAVAKANDKSVDKAGDAKTPDQKSSTWILQAGSFEQKDAAEAMRGKLAMLGFEAKIQSADVSGVTKYRVRVGPYNQIEDAQSSKARLADGGVTATVMRQ